MPVRERYCNDNQFSGHSDDEQLILQLSPQSHRFSKDIWEIAGQLNQSEAKVIVIGNSSVNM